MQPGRWKLKSGRCSTMNESQPSHRDESSQFTCRRCNRTLHPGENEFYLVSIVAVADPSPPNLTEEDLGSDVQLEIRRLIRSMRDLNEQDAQDQVFRRVSFRLCGSCYRQWIGDPTGDKRDVRLDA